MGFVNELYELIGKLNFYEIVHEYEQGLLFSNGRVKDVRVRYSPQDLQAIVEEEKKEYEKQKDGSTLVPKLYFMFPFTRPEMPEGYERSKYTGLPYRQGADAEETKHVMRVCMKQNRFFSALDSIVGALYARTKAKLPEEWKRSISGWPMHKKRYLTEKVLRPAVYLFWPLLQHVVKGYKQERVLNLKEITVPTTDSNAESIVISCNIRIEMVNFYKAYTAVYDYEASLSDYTLSILAKHCRGKSLKDFQNKEKIKEIEKEVTEELRKIVTKDWGVKIHAVYVTDNVPCNVQRHLHEGNAVSLTNNVIQR